MLTGPEIIARVKAGSIVIDPFIEDHVGPNSVDLRMGNKLLVYPLRPRRTVPQDEEGHIFPFALVHEELMEWTDVLDMKKKPKTDELIIPADVGLVLIPGKLYIGSTMEYTESHDVVPGIEGRSSVGRLGIDVHATAGFGDIGFKGTWTLEISVTHPVRVYPGVRICQLYFQEAIGEQTLYTSNKYQGQRDPRPSALWKDFNVQKEDDG